MPSPDGALLAWISDRDGRPRAWVAPLPPARPAVVEPALAAAHATARTTCRGRPGAQLVAGRLLAGLPARPGRRRAHPRPADQPGRQPRSASSPRAPRPSRWAPGRPAGASSASRSSARAAATALACLVDLRDGTSTMLASGPAAAVCAVSGDGRRAVVRLGRRGARRLELFDLRSGRRTELLPGGDANVADARFGVTGGQLFVHTDAGARAARAARRRAERRRRAVSAVPDRRARRRTTSTWSSLDPRGCARRARLERRRPQRGGAARPALGHARAARPAAPGDVVTGAAFTRDGAALLVGERGADGARRGSPGSPSTTATASRDPAAAPAAPRDAASTLVDPVPARSSPARTGCALSGWLFRPTRRVRRAARR